jgi:hypothetical protein
LVYSLESLITLADIENTIERFYSNQSNDFTSEILNNYILALFQADSFEFTVYSITLRCESPFPLLDSIT